MRPSIEQLTTEFLNNANLKVQVSENVQNITLDFLVFGKVYDKFWRVLFECKRVSNFNFTQEPDSEGAHDACFLVLDTEVKEIKRALLNPNDSQSCKAVDPKWQISIFGGTNIDIYCIDFQWEIIELEYDEYSRLLNEP